LNRCTVDYCDSQLGCQHISKHCDDAIACTENKCHCDTGECYFVAVDHLCNDSISCTEDTCNLNLGCVNLPDDFLCDDSDGCTEDLCSLSNKGCVHTQKRCDDDIVVSLVAYREAKSM
jgi:hypothetical protein